tara:strand:+ start:445 stop:1182 length:738 start_codon:yes stop_codon:yes gene_type:complete
MINRFFNIITNFRKKKYDLYTKKKINNILPDLKNHILKNKSCGANFSDYYELYNYIIKKKPKYILECGSGITSYVIAKALHYNFIKSGVKGLCISMEELPNYHEDVKNNFPKELEQFIKFILSKRIEKHYSFYCGVGYKVIPKYDYEFVFIDGPDSISPIDSVRKFNFDLITAVQLSNKKIDCFIDNRLSTTYCYQNIFGKQKVRYDKLKKLGIVKKVDETNLVSQWNKKNFLVNSITNELIFKN